MATLSDTLTGYANALRSVFRSPLNAKSQLLASRNGELVSYPSIQPVGIVETDAELTQQQGQEEAFDVVFNTWQRISRINTTTINNSTGSPWNETGDDWSNEAVPSELDAWTYNSTDNSIECTVNSGSLVGFISPKRFDDYILEAQLTSTATDDDYVGFCIAFAEGADGNTHTLTVTRQLNGPAPMSIIKDWKVQEYVVEHVFDGLTWQDGTVATGPLAGSSSQGWDLIPTGIRLKVTREGDIITIETSQVNDTVIYDPATTVIDLSTDPELAVFRGAHQWGYVCHSQLGSTWDVLQRPGSRYPIVDYRDYSWMLYDNGSWIAQTPGLPALISAGVLLPDHLHFNTTTGRFYFLDGETSLEKVQGSS